MAEVQPNYFHPDYVSPEQLRTLRATSDALLKRSGESVNRPTGAVANMLDALSSALMRRSADTMQSEAASRNASRQTDVFSQLQSGQPMDPRNLAAVYTDPMASPETRALITELVKPQGTKDVYNRPAFASPLQGVQAAPVQGQFQPGFISQDTANGVSTQSPVAAPTVQRGPVASSPRWWGDQEGESAGLYPPRSGGPPRTPANLPAPATASGAYDNPRLDALAAKGREYEAAKTFTQGGAESVSEAQKQDIASAMQAPNIRRIAGVMLDDLRTHGDQMTFGPTAQWSNEIKRAAANYLPGPMKSQLEALASADSFEKMSAQLTSLLARGSGGTDAQLFNSMKSVPGAHNSKQGAEALLKMVLQVADQQQALRESVSHARSAPEYEALRTQFFRNNPVINPITGNPIAVDLQRGAGGGRARIISVEPIR